MSKRCGSGGWLGGVIVVAALLPGPATACDNPVYRYALERWPPDDFLLVAPASAQESLRQQLDAVASRGPRPNLAVLDSAESAEVGRKPEAGRMAVLAPTGGPRTGGFDEIWSGPPTAESLALIADSPARRELAKRLIAGEAIVWVVVERGEGDGGAGVKPLDSWIDEYVRHVVAMDEAKKEEAPEDVPTAQDGKPIDKSAFWPPRMSVLRLRADDPQERVSVALLMASAGPEVAEGSAVFPVFGRGRTLGGELLAKLDQAAFRSACDFLTGACSCEVKEMSPGTDLLLAADWNAVPRLLPPQGADAGDGFEHGDESTKDTENPGRDEAAPESTANKPASADSPTAPLAVWFAGAAGLLVFLALLSRASR